MRTRTRNILILGVAIPLLVIGGPLVGGWVLCVSTVPVNTTDAREYPRILNEWSAWRLVGHFPATVPAQARRVRFSAYPGYLQGGAHIQLRLELPAEEIRQIEIRTRQAAKQVYSGGGIFDHYNRDQTNNVPTASFYTADDRATLDFPPHYTLYVLAAEDRGGAWNHGDTRGIAVSSTTNEVVYWAESW